MNQRSRAVMLTGIAFPLGSVLGAVFGSLTAPRQVQGFQDIVYVLLWFIVSGAPVAWAAFWLSTRSLEWSASQRRSALLRMFYAVFLATGALILAIWFLGRNGAGGFLFIALPLSALIVTVQARRILKV